MARGYFRGDSEALLTLCRNELNEGAATVVDLPAITPLGRLVAGARAAQMLPTIHRPNNAETDRRRRGPAKANKSFADIWQSIGELKARPSTDARAWSDRLSRVWQVWGDGWVLRQALALVPPAVDFSALVQAVSDDSAQLTALMDGERAGRENRGDCDWWFSAYRNAESSLQRRAWIFSALTVPHTRIVVELATQLDEAVARLSPKEYRSMEGALVSFAQASPGSPRIIQDALRKGLASYSGATLWLLRHVSSESGIEEIDKKLVVAFGDLLKPGMGDRRSLLRAVGGSKTVRVESLRGTRALLPAGAWIAAVKVGAMKVAVAAEILGNPEAWPVEMVGRAIQQEAPRLAQLPSMAQLAQDNDWLKVDSGT